MMMLVVGGIAIAAVCIVILLYAQLKSDYPDSQTLFTWAKYHRDISKKYSLDTFIMEQTRDKTSDKDRERIDAIELAYRRLGENMNYDDHVQNAMSYRIAFIVIGVVIAMFGALMTAPNNMIFFLIACLFFVCAYFNMEICTYMLNSRIETLTKDIKNELAIMCAQYAALGNKKPFADSIKSLIPYTEALHNDLYLLYSDARRQTPVVALQGFQQRIQSHKHIAEVTEMVSYLCTIFGGGNVEQSQNKLSNLADKINEDVNFVLDEIKSRNTMIALMCVAGGYLLACVLFMVPIALEAINSGAV